MLAWIDAYRLSTRDVTLHIELPIYFKDHFFYIFVGIMDAVLFSRSLNSCRRSYDNNTPKCHEHFRGPRRHSLSKIINLLHVIKSHPLDVRVLIFLYHIALWAAHNIFRLQRYNKKRTYAREWRKFIRK